MKPTEAAALLAIAAAYDNRKPDPDAATAWAMALDGLRFEDCRQVVVKHYQRSRDWMMPVDVISGVKRLRADRILAFGPYDVPSGLSGAEYAALIGNTNRRIGDGEITSPDQLPTPELVARDVAALGQVGTTVQEDNRATIAAARKAAAAARKAAQAARKPDPEPLLGPDDISREPEPTNPNPAPAVEAATTMEDAT
jgi:hypothetical protein